MQNLHDYIGNSRKWQQLWADDSVAIWFEGTNSGYAVYMAVPNTSFPDSVKIIPWQDFTNLTDTMDVWNALINQHINSLARA